MRRGEVAEDKFFLTNPSLASYGNLSRLLYAAQSKSKNREDYVKSDAKGVRPVAEGEDENFLYEEETINFTEQQYIEIFDHHQMKVMFDSALSDFFQMLRKIAETCAFYFHVSAENSDT